MAGLTLDAARAQWLEHLARDRRLARTTLITYGSVLAQGSRDAICHREPRVGPALALEGNVQRASATPASPPAMSSPARMGG